MIKVPEDTLETLKIATEGGSAVAWVALGDYWRTASYYKTLCERNLEEALRCYQKAHELGNAKGTYRLANCYRNGEGVLSDKEQAYKLFQDAADAGDPDAKFCLGCFYLKPGCSRCSYDEERAEILFREAFAINPGIGFDIGHSYIDGTFKFNPILAEKWFRATIDAGKIEFVLGALLDLAECYEKGKKLSKNLEKAIELYRIVTEISPSLLKSASYHALKSQSIAFLRLGVLYSEDFIIPADFPLAVNYLHLAVKDFFHEEGFLRLGEILFSGRPGILANPEEGMRFLWEIRGYEFAPIPEMIEYYRPLAESGNAEAQYRLSVLLNLQSKKQHPEELDPNSPEIRQSTAARYAESPAATWARTAAEHGNAEARFELYRHLWEFFPQEAAYWLKKAAENNHAYALVVLASCYQNGEKRFGISKNLRTAVSLYEKALALNPEESPLCFLAQCHEELGEWPQAVNYWERAAEYELENFPKSYNAEPFFRLAKLYAAGNVVKKDTVYAAQLMKFAAKGFDGREARIAYADFLRDGIGMPADKKAAEFIYQKESAP